MRLGFDIGGTFIKLFDGRRVEKVKTPRSVEGIVSIIAKKVQKARAGRVGVAVAGLVDIREGVVTESPNLSFLNGTPLKFLLEKELHVPVLTVNDATAAAYAEYFRGAGRGSSLLVCLTIGTGLGGGAVLKGELLLGTSGAAMEVGHTVVEKDGWPCRCGRRGCLEAYVSSYGLEKLYLSKSGRKLPSHEVIQRALLGEPEAKQAVGKMVEYLSVGVMNLVHIFNPDVVVLAGGIPSNYPEIVDMTERLVREKAFPLTLKELTIKLAELGEFSGAIGAWMLSDNLPDSNSRSDRNV
ncbi:ROK family protein [Phorcysia thermohydrogeniphila]|uniref:Glucokinase n=1 Tax=Phorcysia thermohydrogeniphila TaxID=936138 RepID=A0A4R1GH06_9BACT|nr:ROK family protein [Phorcysia thermohydrogeniphila]TCK06263.1 glucokinase [Phorcysia thermohydrogeniphila]